MADRLAIPLDGEFLRKTLRRRRPAPPTAADVLAEAQRIAAAPELAGLSLYRIFYCTAEPFGGRATHPLTRIVTGDSDLVPAMKLARREGLRVLLDVLGSQRVRPELNIHADVVL
jgi:hypothetical protein